MLGFPILYNPTVLATHTSMVYVRSNYSNLIPVKLQGKPAMPRLSFTKQTNIRKRSKSIIFGKRKTNSELSELTFDISKDEILDRFVKLEGRRVLDY
jgi:hypothetical protein